MKKIIIILSIIFFSQSLLFAQTEKKTTTSDVRKSSKSGICYAPSSKSYKKVKEFTVYKTLDECVSAGGRLPKAAAKKKA
jgi:preprotein translocase subunit SecG